MAFILTGLLALVASLHAQLLNSYDFAIYIDDLPAILDDSAVSFADDVRMAPSILSLFRLDLGRGMRPNKQPQLMSIRHCWGPPPLILLCIVLWQTPNIK